MIAQDILAAADKLERGDWFESRPITDRAEYGAWRGCVYTGDTGRDYYASRGFADWFTPPVYRADGCRTSEGASDKAYRIGRAATVAAMREYAASLQYA